MWIFIFTFNVQVWNIYEVLAPTLLVLWYEHLITIKPLIWRIIVIHSPPYHVKDLNPKKNISVSLYFKNGLPLTVSLICTDVNVSIVKQHQHLSWFPPMTIPKRTLHSWKRLTVRAKRNSPTVHKRMQMTLLLTVTLIIALEWFLCLCEGFIESYLCMDDSAQFVKLDETQLDHVDCLM